MRIELFGILADFGLKIQAPWVKKKTKKNYNANSQTTFGVNTAECCVILFWLWVLHAMVGEASVVPDATPEEIAIMEHAK